MAFEIFFSAECLGADKCILIACSITIRLYEMSNEVHILSVLDKREVEAGAGAKGPVGAWVPQSVVHNSAIAEAGS